MTENWIGRFVKHITAELIKNLLISFTGTSRNYLI